MLTRSNVQWMIDRKNVSENIFVATLLLTSIFVLSIDTNYSINILSLNTVSLSMILAGFSLINMFFIVRAIKKHPDYVKTPKRTFHYAPVRSVETFLFVNLIIFSFLTTLLFGILTNTLVQSLVIAAIIFLISLPIKSVFLYFWINRLPT